MTQRVLVTGAAGFVGSHLVALLRAEQPTPQVVGWRRPNPDGDKPRQPAPDTPARLSLRAVDVLDAAAVRRAVEELEPDQVYHCAGAAAVAGSWSDRVSTLRTNVIGTEHLLAAIERAAPSARVLIPGS
ncbi:MAG: NAD-dependent epimerase/dehydratase family protein, partial [Acidobacteria bacterium]|nr:NAD-dependent epimerase/dehydratase family protein [Acidobacteriota bacterium]